MRYFLSSEEVSQILTMDGMMLSCSFFSVFVSSSAMKSLNSNMH